MIDTLLNIAIDINQWRFETDKTKRLLIMINIIRLANEYYEPEFLEYMMVASSIHLKSLHWSSSI